MRRRKVIVEHGQGVLIMSALDLGMDNEYRFPPFPVPPDGVEIVPFSAFAPAGYNRTTEIEVDAWAGIQTIKVLNEEEAALKRKSQKKRKTAGKATDASGRLIPWWEEWEEDEAQRTMSESSFENLTRFEDRICLAADDFRVGRIWPEISQGVRLMWDQFRLYIGLISSIPVYKRIKNKKGQVDGPNNGQEASDEEGDAPKAKDTKVVIVQDYLEQIALPGKKLEPSPDESTVEAQRLRAFLGDIEKTVKVFLSSYMRDTGLIWTERNLFIAPAVLHFFLRFMLRNKVFADSAPHRDDLERAVAVAALARQELPATAQLGQMLPGHFDIGCKECWGIQGSLSVQISTTLPPAIDPEPNGTQSDASSAFETELKAHDVEVVPSNVVLDSITARQVMEDNLDTEEAPVTRIPVAGDPWIAAVCAEEYTTASWTDVAIPWLMPILGPTVVPLVVQTGIVEYSTRKILKVIEPGVGGTGVQGVLGERFFKVVMGPWVGCKEEATLDFPGPTIVPGSRAVIPEMMPDGIFDEHEDPWNPYVDELTILVDEAVAGQTAVGMGLCGTWVEMVEDDKRHGRENYWYVESLVACVPSYYTEGETEIELDEDEDL